MRPIRVEPIAHYKQRIVRRPDDSWAKCSRVRLKHDDSSSFPGFDHSRSELSWILEYLETAVTMETETEKKTSIASQRIGPNCTFSRSEAE